MSSIVTNVLNVTFGLLWNKLHDHTANKLKEGDLTDEKCRQLIVRELDEIKSKLDGLARKDLLSSISFLNEGARLLCNALDRLRNDAEARSVNQQEGVSEAEGPAMLEFDGLKHDGNSVYSEVFSLSQAIKRLKITSEEHFISAKVSFQDARKEATRAFNNKALSTEDRILATKLRVISRILGSLENPNLAVDACKGYLEELHDIPAIQEIFSVHFSSGMKSRFKKTKRLENVKSVIMISYILCNFIVKTDRTALDMFSWPTIKSAEDSLHPLMDYRIVTLMESLEIYATHLFTFGEGKKASYGPDRAAVNSKGEIMILNYDRDSVDVINRGGEIQFCFFLPKEGSSTNTRCQESTLAIDTEDNVYIITSGEGTDKNHFKLSVFGSKGDFKQQVPLTFLTGHGSVFSNVCIAVNKNKSIFITVEGEACVYVCDSSGQFKYSFPLKIRRPTNMSISDNNEIIAAEMAGKTVYVYTEEGKLKRKLKVPEDRKVFAVAFNHFTKKIIAFTGHQLEQYHGEHRQTLQLPFGHQKMCNISSHPNGPAAVVHEKGVIFI